jgi:uncharacterized delta-60 repeat protein
LDASQRKRLLPRQLPRRQETTENISASNNILADKVYLVITLVNSTVKPSFFMKVAHTFLARRVVVLLAMVLGSLPAWAQSSGIDPTFPPVQVTLTVNGTSTPAQINDVVRQADGKYIIGGDFMAVNGVPAFSIARLEANGTVDAAFTAASAADGPVNSLALQPDGRLLVGGAFTTLGGSPRALLGRLLTSGALDPTFSPYTPTTTAGMSAGRVLVQPDGQVLVSGVFNLRGAGLGNQRIVRLQGSTGQYDTSFEYTLPTPDTSPSTILLQPDGYVLVGGYGPSYRQAAMLARLKPDGTVDGSFAGLESTFTSELNALALDNAGRIYAGGMFQNGPGNASLRRYLPNGTIDNSFAYHRTGLMYVRALAVQPNGRLLVGHVVAERVQPSGSADASFLAGISGTIRRFLVQPDGAIMIAGRALTGTAGAVGLVRVLDSNVLHTAPSAAQARTAAWPVPARNVLYLSLDATSHPQQVQLLDALGRTVRTLNQPAATATLSVEGLPAGTYLVQVDYATAGRVVQRIVVQ